MRSTESLPLLLILVAIQWVGCARFEPKPIAPAQTAAEFDGRRLDSPNLRKFLEENFRRDMTPRPPKVWDFPTLSLVAFFYHPSLETARAQWAVANSAIRTAGARPNPTVGLIPEYSFNPPSGVSPWLPSLTTDWPIETAGKRGLRLLKARHLSESARLNLATTAWQVRSHLRRRLIEHTSAILRADLLRRQLAIQDEIVRLLEQRASVGAIARAELAPALVQREKTRLELNQAGHVRAEALVNLAEALGVPVRALEGAEISIDLATTSDATPDLLSTESRRQALQSRTDVLSALADYAAAQAALQLEIARQYPDVHLGTGYQWDQGQNKWSLGLTVELPVLNRNQGPIAEAEAHRTESSARFAAVQASIIAELDRAVSAYHVSREQWATVEAVVANQQRRFETVEAEFKAGVSDRLDLLNAQLERGLVEITRLESQIQIQNARAALEDAMQRPLDAVSPASIERAQSERSETGVAK